MAKQVYGPDITEAIASGDLALMKAAARRAEEHLQTYDRVVELLALLRVEIAKYERQLGCD